MTHNAARRIIYKSCVWLWRIARCHCSYNWHHSSISCECAASVCIDYVSLLGGWFWFVLKIETICLQAGQISVFWLSGNVKVESALLSLWLFANDRRLVSFFNPLYGFPHERIIINPAIVPIEDIGTKWQG
jgi:hypothetical protein